jgi:hypothetical protein
VAHEIRTPGVKSIIFFSGLGNRKFWNGEDYFLVTAPGNLAETILKECVSQFADSYTRQRSSVDNSMWA